MKYESTFQDQVRHVRSREWDLMITENEPVSVVVSDQDRDRKQTVRPCETSCSCSVQGDIGLFCDHLIAVLDDDDYEGALTREYLKEWRNDLEVQACKTQGSTEAIEEKISKITEVLTAIDADQSMARTQFEMVSAMRETAGAEAGDKTNRSIQISTPEEDREIFREMVRRVRVEEQDRWMPFDG